jgi:hypothetical protein
MQESRGVWGQLCENFTMCENLCVREREMKYGADELNYENFQQHSDAVVRELC